MKRRKKVKKRREKTPTRTRILDVAAHHFANHGYGLTSMRTIARTGRIRVATLYHYFKSKQTLYAEVLERERERIHEVMNHAISEEENFAQQITDMMMGAFDHHYRDPTFLKLALRAFLGEGRNSPYDIRWLGTMEEILRPRIVRGEVKQVDPLLFMASAGALVTQHVLNLPAYQETLGKKMSKKEIESLVRDHVNTMVLRCLGLDGTS